MAMACPTLFASHVTQPMPSQCSSTYTTGCSEDAGTAVRTPICHTARSTPSRTVAAGCGHANCATWQKMSRGARGAASVKRNLQEQPLDCVPARTRQKHTHTRTHLCAVQVAVHSIPATKKVRDKKPSSYPWTEVRRWLIAAVPYALSLYLSFLHSALLGWRPSSLSLFVPLHPSL